MIKYIFRDCTYIFRDCTYILYILYIWIVFRNLVVFPYNFLDIHLSLFLSFRPLLYFLKKTEQVSSHDLMYFFITYIKQYKQWQSDTAWKRKKILIIQCDKNHIWLFIHIIFIWYFQYWILTILEWKINKVYKTCKSKLCMQPYFPA